MEIIILFPNFAYTCIFQNVSLEILAFLIASFTDLESIVQSSSIAHDPSYSTENVNFIVNIMRI